MFLKEGEGPNELAGPALRQTSMAEPSTSGTSKASQGSLWTLAMAKGRRLEQPTPGFHKLATCFPPLSPNTLCGPQRQVLSWEPEG